MGEIKIVPVNNKEKITTVSCLAKSIWFEHYSTILSEGQIEYMVNRFQSKKAISAQIEEGYQYFIVEYEGENAGYFAISIAEENVFLSKLYVDKKHRKKGIARHVTDFLCSIGLRDGCKKIWLTVNRNNHGSITAYQALGFRSTRAQTVDIGEGYVMDDYVMEKDIK